MQGQRIGDVRVSTFDQNAWRHPTRLVATLGV